MTLSARIKQLPFTPLQLTVHLGTWSYLALLAFDFVTHRLTANPLQALQQRLGLEAVTLLLLSMACAPLSNLLGWRELLKRSRTLGLYAFMVSVLHVLIFLDLDNGLAWSFFAQTIAQKPYILFGIATFLLLIPLAMTSFDIWKARLGRNWKRLHQLIYIITPLAVLHFALSKKGDIFRLQGDIVRPFVYGLIVAALLASRLPPVRRFFASLRPRIAVLFIRWTSPRAAKVDPQPTSRP